MIYVGAHEERQDHEHYETDDQESTTDLDSHADTCVVGKNALIILDFESTKGPNS